MENREKVIAQYEAIRRSGLTNMFDRHRVQRIAYDNDFYELVNAAEDDYGAILGSYSELMKLINEADIPTIEGVNSKGGRDQ